MTKVFVFKEGVFRQRQKKEKKKAKVFFREQREEAKKEEETVSKGKVWLRVCIGKGES